LQNGGRTIVGGEPSLGWGGRGWRGLSRVRKKKPRPCSLPVADEAVLCSTAGVAAQPKISLEIELQSDLPAAFPGTNARRYTEVIHQGPCARSGSERNPAKSEIRAIEDIEEFRPKFNVDGFRNPRPLDKAHIVIIGIRIPQFA